MDLVEPDVQLDRTFSHEGKRNYDSYTGNAGIYPGLDRFGRVVRHAWMDGRLTTHATSSTLPSRPPIVDVTHAYDKASNVLDRIDARPGAQVTHRDFAYSYDALHRLIESLRGVNGGTFTPTPTSTRRA